MAGNPTNNITISIYPLTSIFSAHYVDDLAGSGLDVTFTNSDCSISSNYLVYDTVTSGSGGNILTITAYGHQYVIEPINDSIVVNLPTQSLYAWTDNAGLHHTIYTLSSTPEEGDKIYNQYGQMYVTPTTLDNGDNTWWLTYDEIGIGDSSNIIASAGPSQGGATAKWFTRNSTNDIIVPTKPEHLYGWTDSSVTGEQLYGWTNGTTTVYTKSATPANSSNYYDANGNAYGQYDLEVNGLALYAGISTYDSTNNLIKISGDPA